MVKIPHGCSSLSIDLFKAMLQWLANCLLHYSRLSSCPYEGYSVIYTFCSPDIIIQQL